MVEKFKLIGTNNDGFRHRYSVQKKESFKKAFLNFMEDLDFDKEKIMKSFWVCSEEALGEDVELKISGFEDEVHNYKNKGYDVDVFYGKTKIILVVRTKKRFRMIDHLKKKANWIMTPSFQKVKEKKKQRVILHAKARKKK